MERQLSTSVYSPRASLALLGMYFRSLEVWPLICEQVVMDQKVLQHRPHEKLLDCLINILAGGRGLYEITTRVHPDEGLQRAFGRRGGASHSTISDTLDACTLASETQMCAAMSAGFRRHSQSYWHDYTHSLQQLDADLTGWSAGAQCAGAQKAYFSDHLHRRGRHLGRVVASRYDEVVVDRLYPGSRQLEHCLPELVSAAAATLACDGDSAAARKQRENTVIRVDGGGGTEADINWLLTHDYRVMLKVHNPQRTLKLTSSVRTWYPDPRVSGRHVGWVECPTPYATPTRQLAIRHRKTGGQHAGEFGYSVLVFNLSDAQLTTLVAPTCATDVEAQGLFNALHYYDLRGGGVETQFKGDKAGLGLAHRNKRGFYAHAMVVQLGVLAHNVLIWARHRLASINGHFLHFGPLRLVRDVFSIDGVVHFDATQPDTPIAVDLNPRHPYAAVVEQAFNPPYV